MIMGPWDMDVVNVIGATILVQCVRRLVNNARGLIAIIDKNIEDNSFRYIVFGKWRCGELVNSLEEAQDKADNFLITKCKVKLMKERHIIMV